MDDRRGRVTRHETEGGARVTSLTLSASEWVRGIAATVSALAVLFGLVSAGLNQVWISPLVDREIEAHAVEAQKRMDSAAKQYVTAVEFARWTSDKDARWRALDQDIADIKRLQERLLDNQEKIMSALAKIH